MLRSLKALSNIFIEHRVVYIKLYKSKITQIKLSSFNSSRVFSIFSFAKLLRNLFLKLSTEDKMYILTGVVIADKFKLSLDLS